MLKAEVWLFFRAFHRLMLLGLMSVFLNVDFLRNENSLHVVGLPHVCRQVEAKGLGADMGEWLAKCLALPPVSGQVPPLEGLDTQLLRQIGLKGHFHGLSLPEE